VAKDIENATPEAKAPESPWTALLKTVGEKVTATLLTGAGLLGFVAFAGGVVLWTRFSALQLPQDQVVDAVPQGELIAVGAAMLLLFGFFGILATLVVYLIDRGGRSTPGMSRGLLLIVLVESAVAIWFATDRPADEKVLATEVLALTLGAIFWSTFVGGLVRHKADLPDFKDDELQQPEKHRAFRRAGGRSGVGPVAVFATVALSMVVGLGVLFLVEHIAGLSGTAAGICALAAVGSILLAGVGLRCLWFELVERRTLEARDAQRRMEKAAAQRRVNEAAAKKEKDDEKWPKRRARLGEFLAAWMTASWEWRGDRSHLSVSGPPEREKREAEAELREAPKEDDVRRKPSRFRLSFPGTLVVTSLAIATVVFPALIVGEAWLAASLASVVVLGAGLWRIADLSSGHFVRYGLAVFISVPLFGTLMLMARNLGDPQAQPVALIRKTDRSGQALQGLYVTESDKRIYFANVATEGCDRELVPDSGRLLWVPKEDVVAMSIGPLQDVDKAARSALEMSYALTRSVETSSGRRVDLEAGEDAPSLKVEGKKARLQDPGPAVRPNFGRGLRLHPDQAPPGKEVTLTMSTPNRKIEDKGFGKARGGRTLRLGGVEVDIVKERARSAAGAEFVGLEGGGELTLEKGGTLYTRVQGEGIVEVNDEQKVEEESFVKLKDPSVVAVIGGEGRRDTYLQVENGRLATEPSVTLNGVEEPVALKRELRRQAWYPNHIRFVVPDDATSGVVTVECRQLAGEPVLQVVRKSTARIAVRMKDGSQRVVFDSRHSGAEGGAVTSRQWTIAGRPMGGGVEVAADLPPRGKAYSVQLTVENADGETDSASLKLLRIPAPLFEFDEDSLADTEAIGRTRRVVRETVKEAPPAAIEVHGHADDVGTAAYNLRLALRRAVYLRDKLLTGKSGVLTGDTSPGKRIPVTTRAFGETCPIDRRSGPRMINRRVEIFILGRGAIVTTSEGCRAGRVKQTRW
jgi:outer membrane protein OmpA-like peptidoglycan-associated protein